MKRLWAGLLTFILIACGPTPTPAPLFPPTTPLPKAATGTLLRQIQDRGKLIAGVKYDLPLFGLIDRVTNKVAGFDIEIARAIARKIFGDPDKIEFKETISRDRIPFLQQGAVDIVVSTMTITEERRQQIDFSDVYYVAGQSLLIREDQPIRGLADLPGKKVCSAKGSTSAENIRRKAPQAQLLLYDTYSECLLALQKGQVDVISTDDTILMGLALTDPKTRLVGGQFTEEPYGVGIAKGHPELLAVVNDTIRELKASGQWAEIYRRIITSRIPSLQPPASPP